MLLVCNISLSTVILKLLQTRDHLSNKKKETHGPHNFPTIGLPQQSITNDSLIRWQSYKSTADSLKIVFVAILVGRMVLLLWDIRECRLQNGEF